MKSVVSKMKAAKRRTVESAMQKMGKSEEIDGTISLGISLVISTETNSGWQEKDWEAGVDQKIYAPAHHHEACLWIDFRGHV